MLSQTVFVVFRSDMVEAAVSSGASTTQVVTKVQLPASKRSLLLGANQGMIFVLAVVVIGGFVGAGGLGYLVIVGQSKPELQGKGLAAGLAIVLLGVVMDRIAQAGARRNEKTARVAAGKHQPRPIRTWVEPEREQV